MFIYFSNENSLSYRRNQQAHGRSELGVWGFIRSLFANCKQVEDEDLPGLGGELAFIFPLHFRMKELIILKTLSTLLFILKYLLNQRIGSKTIEFCEAEPGFTIDLPSSYHGKWKVSELSDSPRAKDFPWNFIIAELMQLYFRFELEMTTTLSWPRMISVLQSRSMLSTKTMRDFWRIRGIWLLWKMFLDCEMEKVRKIEFFDFGCFWWRKCAWSVVFHYLVKKCSEKLIIKKVWQIDKMLKFENHTRVRWNATKKIYCVQISPYKFSFHKKELINSKSVD